MGQRKEFRAVANGRPELFQRRERAFENTDWEEEENGKLANPDRVQRLPAAGFPRADQMVERFIISIRYGLAIRQSLFVPFRMSKCFRRGPDSSLILTPMTQCCRLGWPLDKTSPKTLARDRPPNCKCSRRISAS